MRAPRLLARLAPCLAPVAIACAPDAPTGSDPIRPSFTVGGGCSLPFVTAGVLQPINADNSSSFKLGRTIPVKIRVSDCVTGEAINTLAPQISLVLLDLGGTAVNEVISSSAADEGNTMRSAGDGQYIFNLSTRLSRFNAWQDLTGGVYQLTISSPGDFADVVVQFAVRP